MKKIIISILLILTVSFLSWCNNSDELFEKKQDCIKYKDEIKKNVEIRFWKVEKFNYVKEIFYSSKLNTCIYTVNQTNIWWIYDYLENKIILELESPLKCWCEETQQKFDLKIKELKWE